ncbi:MAG: type 1 glutamine amidotransferase domain-containing protein [Candidatus Eisenbacteria bacterium]
MRFLDPRVLGRGLRRWPVLLLLFLSVLRCLPVGAGEVPSAARTDSLAEARVLLVVTSRATLDDPGLPTGADPIELLDGFERFTTAGFAVDLVSPLGGAVPLESTATLDPHRKTLLEMPTMRRSLAEAGKLSDVSPARYRAVYIVGGHGALWDLARDEALGKILLDLARRGGVIGAVGHGVAALLEVKTDETWLVSDRTVTGATNAEEAAAGLLPRLPLSIQSTAGTRGARWNDNGPGKPNVCVSRGIVTGQNAISAGGVVHFMLQLLEKGAVHSGR